jgi:hypothetical protein
MNKPLDRLRHHVTGAIERGESVAIVERTVGNSDPMAELFAEHRKVLAERDELVAALRAVVGNIDVSTINNSKRSTERWIELKEQARAALASRSNSHA